MYDRRIDGRTLDFGHEGVLYDNSFVMYDKQTDSKWIHTTGICATGALRGKQLEFLPCEIVAWGSWLDAYQDSLVLDEADPSGGTGRMGYNLTEENAGRYGLSLGSGRKAKLYPYELLMKSVLVSDEFKGRQVIVLYDPGSESARAFETGGHSFSWSEDQLKDERGVFWSPTMGTSARKGEEPLVRLPVTTWLQRRWQRFYPTGKVFGRGR